MNADVLLLRLNHPHSLLPHLVHDSEDIHHVVLPDALEDPVDGDHGSGSADPGAAVNNDWSLLWTHTLTECSNKPIMGIIKSGF